MKLSPIPVPDRLKIVQQTWGELYATFVLGHPAGSCFGRPRDVLKVLQLHLAGGVHDGIRLISREALAEMHTVQFADELSDTAKDGQEPAFQRWGLRPLMQGSDPAEQIHSWFSFHDQDKPDNLGHAGISMIIGTCVSSRDLAFILLTTDAPKPNEQTTVRNCGMA